MCVLVSNKVWIPLMIMSTVVFIGAAIMSMVSLSVVMPDQYHENCKIIPYSTNLTYKITEHHIQNGTIYTLYYKIMYEESYDMIYINTIPYDSGPDIHVLYDKVHNIYPINKQVGCSFSAACLNTRQQVQYIMMLISMTLLIVSSIAFMVLNCIYFIPRWYYYNDYGKVTLGEVS